MFSKFQHHLNEQLDKIRTAGLYKEERFLASSQQSHIKVANGKAANGKEVLNLCANNYLGLANHPTVVQAAQQSLDQWGFGMASVRFICGTQSIHKELESRISKFLGTEDTILYPSCFDANGGLFETLLTKDDAILSDELNHASIIDGVRLCKAQRFRHLNANMTDLEQKLKDAKDARFRMIATDGVFSMDGTIAPLDKICDLADKHDALVMFDDCHAAGFLGKTGRGTHEFCGVIDRVDIITGTLGKALGGASGGYTSGKKEIIEMLRQRSRPYLFSNSVAPPIVAASLAVFDLLEQSTALRDTLMDNTAFFREEISKVGLEIVPGEHPITPIMLGDAKLANTMAARLLERGVYVIGFSFPVVPKGKARIRTQISAAHTQDDLKFAIEQFAAVKKELGI